MKLTIKQIFFLASILMACFSSCVSTETLDSPSDNSVNGEQIVLTVAAPEKVGTRSEGHFLRYVAKLFKNNSGSSSLEFVERKELKEGENDNIIIFQAPASQKYTVIVFADYLPESTQPDASGMYPDCYYNTQSKDENITMKAFTGSDHTGNILLNNDNFDCFSDFNTFTKTEAEERIPFNLKRATAKVRFVANENVENFKKIGFSQLYFHDWFNQYGNDAVYISSFQNSWLKAISFEETSSVIDENEIFYFYTLAGSSSKNLSGDIKFTVTGNTGEPKETIVYSGTIPVQRNYITTVKGSFIPNAEVENPEPDIPDGDIVLELSVNNNWDSPEKSVMQ